MLTLNTGNQVPVDQEIVCIHTRYGDIKDGDAGYILETKVMFVIFVSNPETISCYYCAQV